MFIITEAMIACYDGFMGNQSGFTFLKILVLVLAITIFATIIVVVV